jgi:hypothetical protein
MENAGSQNEMTTKYGAGQECDSVGLHLLHHLLVESVESTFIGGEGIRTSSEAYDRQLAFGAKFQVRAPFDPTL